ncbi:MAG: hypothetical protein ACTHK3_07905 [Solirubrobacterales bacterium]
MASEGQSGVLSKITKGSCLGFQFANTDQWIDVNKQRVLVPGQEGRENFYAVTYVFDGKNQAKVSMAWSRDPRYSLGVAQDQGLENALMVLPAGNEFMFTENGEGLITISNTVAPPAPFVGIHQGSPSYLATGFTDAAGQCSLFAINIGQDES